MKVKIGIWGIVFATLIALAFGALGPAPIGEVVDIPAQTTVIGLQSVLNMSPGTFVLTNGKLILMSWPDVVNYNFMVLNAGAPDPVAQLARETKMIGNQISISEMDDLVLFLRSLGWKEVSANSLNFRIINGIHGFIAALGMVGNLPITDFFVVPAGIFENMPIYIVEG